MPVYIDQLNRSIEIHSTPERIISLVPSQTELLHDLGLDEEVIGITKFCVHPQEWFNQKTRIGGTKKIDLEKIKALQPDLILANKEENVKEQVEALAAHFPVWISDVNTLKDAYRMMDSIGEIISKKEKAESLISRMKTNFIEFQTPNPKRQTCYLIWKDPYMTVGADTFIHHMMEIAGFQNVFANSTRYPVITIEDLQATYCPLLFLSSEPFPFKQKHADQLQQQLPHTKIVLVDGEIFSWYGSRLLQAAGYFRNLHHQIAVMA